MFLKLKKDVTQVSVFVLERYWRRMDHDATHVRDCEWANWILCTKRQPWAWRWLAVALFRRPSLAKLARGQAWATRRTMRARKVANLWCFCSQAARRVWWQARWRAWFDPLCRTNSTKPLWKHLLHTTVFIFDLKKNFSFFKKWDTIIVYYNDTKKKDKIKNGSNNHGLQR